MPKTDWELYLQTLKTNFRKRTRLEFLQPDNTVAFVIDDNSISQRDKTFIQNGGSLSVNLQNGMRRTASIQLANVNDLFSYNVNNVWIGTKVRLLMGVQLPNGLPYLLPQGVFYIKDPQESLRPNENTITLSLVDKWAVLDGTLGGQLEGTYECPVNSNIFEAMSGILQIDSGNGIPIDTTPPVFTDYYNDKIQKLPDGSFASLVRSPYTARFDSEGDTYADVLLGLNEMIAGWIGYDAYGALRVDASQDDIIDADKPLQWEFSTSEQQFLGATYTILASEVKNDIIRVGQALNDGHAVVGGRAQNFDPRSDTNINIIGLKTDRQSKAGYYTNQVCMDLAEFELKRNTVLKKSISISSQQMFHLTENSLVLIRRPDKQGNPYEKHLINGFTIPIGQTGEMTISATSISDFPIATVTSLSDSLKSMANA